MSGGALYLYLVKFLTKRNLSRNKSNDLKIENNKHKSFYNKIIKEIMINDHNDQLLIASISTFTMLLIMTAVYLRVDSKISIIFIFLIRIFQSNMLNSLKNSFDN